MSASFQEINEQVDSSTLAFPMLSWNSPESKSKYTPEQNVMMYQKSLECESCYSTGSGSTPVAMSGSASSVPASFYSPLNFNETNKNNKQGSASASIEQFENSPLCSNYYGTNYSTF